MKNSIFWLLVFGYWYWYLVIGYWYLVIGYWYLLLVIGYGYWYKVFVFSAESTFDPMFGNMFSRGIDWDHAGAPKIGQKSHFLSFSKIR